MISRPVPAGPMTQIHCGPSAYPGFPAACQTADGTGLLMVRGGEPKSTGHFAGAGHANATPCALLLRQPPDQSCWSEPALMLPPGPAIGFGGMACEDADQGGLVLAAMRVNGTPGAVLSDDAGLYWSPFVAMPSPTGTDVPGGPVWHGGAFYLPTYGPISGASTTPVVRVYASTDRGQTWALRSTLGIAGRLAQEPVMVSLIDGRLGMLVRSDGATASTYDYLYTATSSDCGLTWTQMTGAPSYLGLQIPHGSGQPNAAVLPDGRVMVVHRGKTEPVARASVWAQPCAVSLLDAGLQKITDGSGKVCWQFLDLVDGDPRLMVYGAPLPDRIIVALHNGPPNPNLLDDNATATLYERFITSEVGS